MIVERRSNLNEPTDAFAAFLDRLRGIDDEIEDDLVKLTEMTGECRKIVCKVGFQLSNILPLPAGDLDRAFDRLIDIEFLMLLAAGMGKLLDGLNDL